MKKRILALVFSMVLVTALVGCANSATKESNSSETTPTITESLTAEATAETTPTKEAVDSTADNMIQTVEAVGQKGDKINTVAYIPMAVSNELFLSMADAFVEKLNDAGFKAEYTSPDFDVAKQIEIFENYVAQGFDCIIVFPINAESLNNAVKTARAQGVKVICQVNKTEECDGWVGSDGVAMGQGTCQVAANWVDKTFPAAQDKSIKCAVLTYRTDDNNSAISDAMEKIEDYSSKIKVETVVECAESSIAYGQSLAENLYTTNPDIQLIISEEPSVAVGVANYYSGADTPLKELSTFGVFCNNGDSSTYDLIKSSPENKSVLRGISSVAPVPIGAQIVTNIVINLSNGIENDSNFTPDPVYLITPENVDAFMDVK